MTKKIGVALLGLGTVGYGTYQILTKNREYIKKCHGVDIEIVHILEKNTQRIRELGIDEGIVSTDILNVVNNPKINIVCEFFGGIEPARSFLIAALKAGKSMVTANKELFSKHWRELDSAAREGNAGVYFEASCVGGVPIIRTLTASLQGDKIQSLVGIFNGTTNFILSKMSDEGLDYSTVLAEAQRLGYAEANPSNDVDGFDSMYKLSILSTLAFHKPISLDSIYREGISKISKLDIEYAKEFGYAIKLLAIAKNHDDGLELRVHPTFVPNSHPLASVKGSFNAVFVGGDNVGDIMLYGRGAGDLPTGSAIVSDIVYCALQTQHKYMIDDTGMANAKCCTNFNSEYYIRISADDKSGVLSKIAGIFGKYDISISSMQQKNMGAKASIIFFTHKTDEDSVNHAIAEIKSLNSVASIDSIIRVL